MDIDAFVSSLPPKYIAWGLFALAVLRALDGLVRSIDDSKLPAHTFGQAVVHYSKLILGFFAKKPGAAALLLACSLALGSAGCAPGLDGYRQTVAVTSRVSASTVDTLRSLNASQEASFKARAEAPGTDLTALQADIASWRKIYDSARVGVSALDVSIVGADAAIKLVEAGTAKMDVVVGAIADVARIASDLAKSIQALRGVTK